MNDLNKEFKKKINQFTDEFKSNFSLFINCFIANQCSKNFTSNDFSQLVLYQYIQEYFNNFFNNMNKDIMNLVLEKIEDLQKVIQNKNDECLLEYLRRLDNKQYPINRIVELLEDKLPKKVTVNVEKPKFKKE